MKCKKCNHEYDDKLLECPNCGYQPLSDLDDVDVPKELSHYSKEELYKRIKAQAKAKKYIIPVIIAIALLGVVAIYNKTRSSTKQYNHVTNIRDGLGFNNVNAIGNTTGNINNDGIASRSGSYYYVVNETYQLVKMEADFSRYQVLSTTSNKFINVVGNFVYFINQEDNQIYRVNLTSNTKTKISDNQASNMQIIGDWIYYINKEDNNTIYSMRVDGKEKTKLTSKSSDYLSIYGDWIYYNVEDIGIYKLPLRGGSQELVVEMAMKEFIIVDDYIYFIDDENYIKKINLNDLGEVTTLVNEEVTNLIVSDKKIYFINQDNQIAQTNLNGGSYKVISPYTTNVFNIVGDWIIYYKQDEERFYKLSKYEDINIPLFEDDAIDTTITNGNNSINNYTYSNNGITP